MKAAMRRMALRKYVSMKGTYGDTFSALCWSQWHMPSGQATTSSLAKEENFWCVCVSTYVRRLSDIWRTIFKKQQQHPSAGSSCPLRQTSRTVTTSGYKARRKVLSFQRPSGGSKQFICGPTRIPLCTFLDDINRCCVPREWSESSSVIPPALLQGFFSAGV